MQRPEGMSQKDFDQFIEDSRSWEADKAIIAAKSEKKAWTVAKFAGVLAGIAIIGISVMGPMKKVVPVVVRVNETTGVVEVVDTTLEKKLDYGPAVAQAYARQYVNYRESYNHNTSADYYTKVGNMSSSTEQQRYFALYNPKNPESPINVYQDFATVKIKIKSTSLLTPNVALVRYVKMINRGTETAYSDWIATITFDYLKPSMKWEERTWNMLGYTVIDYKNDSEGEPYKVSKPVSEPVKELAPAQRIFPKSAEAEPQAADPA